MGSRIGTVSYGVRSASVDRRAIGRMMMINVRHAIERPSGRRPRLRGPARRRRSRDRGPLARTWRGDQPRDPNDRGDRGRHPTTIRYGQLVSRLVGRVQRGEGDASRWLSTFNAAYARKVGMPVFPGSLNLALGAPFDWFDPAMVRRTVAFDRTEYGGERDILLIPCLLVNLGTERAWLWTTTSAAHDPAELRVIELIAAVNLRETYGLVDGSPVEVQLLDVPHAIA